ncbi:MAG TPA: LysM peptidoglycan-binding domain-containing protein [Frankiaceae bacterium]|jgi:LysM repeat protein|nr:LysM peptidoglycan-binding domain-containing protein [Frankiaceae bacterium]
MTFDTPLRPSSGTSSHPSAAPSAPSVSAGRLAPVRLTRRGRALLVLLLVGTVLVAFSLGRTSASAGSSSGSARPPAPRTAIVEPGETLWSIARRVAPSADPRLTVARLAELNGLGSAPIVAGQRLVLP